MDDRVPVGGRLYFFFLMLLLLSRGADFLSTWIATPNMVLEGNPLARKLGWKWGSFLNLVLCGTFAAWPVAAIVIGTTSVLVAARNFQAAWLMRSLGEENYRDWYVEQLRQASLPLYLFCLLAQTLQDWELLIIDDGSPDATAQQVAPYLTDARIRYCRLPLNCGLGAALTRSLGRR